jgi:hypothetical protein
METLKINRRWRAILLGALVVGAMVLTSAAGIVYSKQHSDFPAAVNRPDASPAVIEGTKAQDSPPLLDSFDRATALHEHRATEPVDATPLLDTFDRATALRPTRTPKQKDDPRDLSGRRATNDPGAIMAGISK